MSSRLPAKDSMLVVVGSGPGIGSATAAVFAANGFSKIVLIARNADRLKQDCRVVEDAARNAGKDAHVDCHAVDITDTAAYKLVLDKVARFGALECVFFNAARVEQSELLKHPVEDIEYDFKITNSALYVTAQWAIPQLQRLAKHGTYASPSMLITNSLLYKQPSPQHFALSMVKTAQRNMVQSLQMKYEPEGIHVALISVGGPVGRDASVLNPDNIARQTWNLFSQAKGEWTWDLELVEQ
ncbi:hypothetical protein MBLNU459_g5720t1 [Dothideomycetes sp. NU459]